MKVSIILPTYNRSKFLNRSIESVINQTLHDWELLVVDDGSTDDTNEVVSKYTKIDDRIKYFYQENSNTPSSPKNKGIKMSQGEYIAFIDDDDEWLPTKLEKQLKLFEKSNNRKLGLVNCYVNIKNNKTDKILKRYKEFYRGDVKGEIIKSCFINNSSCVMIKTSVFEKTGLFDIKLRNAEDWDMWIRISLNNYDFDFVPEYLTNYYIHENNISKEEKNRNRTKDYFYIKNKNINEFEKYETIAEGYSYFFDKKYKKAFCFFIKKIFSKKLNNRERIKTLGYMTVSLFPFLNKPFSKIWYLIK